jgi:hypothetical protein
LSRRRSSDYDSVTTARCERALVTLLGDLGPWSERVFVVGGLAPRYIVGQLPEGAPAHIGTTDVDLVIGLALGDDTPETYRTLETNLKRSGFGADTSFRWTRLVDGVTVQPFEDLDDGRGWGTIAACQRGGPVTTDLPVTDRFAPRPDGPRRRCRPRGPANPGAGRGPGDPPRS